MYVMTIKKDKFHMYNVNECQKHYAEQRNLDTGNRTSKTELWLWKSEFPQKWEWQKGNGRDHLERDTGMLEFVLHEKCWSTWNHEIQDT